MAQTYTPGTDPDPTEEKVPKKSGFHYYSGGEVKELEHTNVSPMLWGFFTVLILGALGYLVWGGALGPNSPLGGFKPTGGSAASHAMIQADVNQKAMGDNGLQAADMIQLKPFLAGDSLNTAIANGSETYQKYCIGCHGPNQDGNGVGAAALNPKPRNLHDAPFMRETLNYQRINNSLHYGVHGTAMPPWGTTLSEHEIQEVIAYALSLTWTMPPSADMDTTTGQLGTPPPVKSITGSTTGTAGGVTVHGGSVMSSPAPITPPIGGNPAADTSTAPPSMSGSTAPKNDAPIVR